MCTITGVVGLVTTIGSAVFGGMNAMSQANAQNAQMEYNAKIAENNARNAQAEADYARAQGWRNANEKRRETALLIGAQRAKMGASGAVAGSGSFLDVELDTKEQGELDAMALAQEGDMAAWRAELQRDNYLQNANMSRASKVSTSGAMWGGLLGGAANVGSAYYGMSQAGVFDSKGTTNTAWYNKHGLLS